MGACDMPNKIRIELSRDEALVFFEWLTRFNKTDSAKFEDQAEQRVLWDLEAMLESSIEEPLTPAYNDLLMQARAKVRDSVE